jgi:hypothetical protein
VSHSSFTGPTVTANGLASRLQSKYDAVLAVGVGTSSLRNFDALSALTGNTENIFFATNGDELTYLLPWMQNFACPYVFTSYFIKYKQDMYVIKLIDLVWIKARFYPSYFQI